MKKKPATPFDAAELRCQAEVQLSERNKKAEPPPARVTETMRLVHELEVHQIELEMQNEELAQSRAKVEALLRQYTNLYDFAPVGYFTLARDGAIHQANLAGASLLGLERGKLITRRFGLFVSSETRPAFNAFLEKVFSTSGSKETCEVAFLKDGPDPLWAHIEATTEDGQERCYIVAVDITERKRAEEASRQSEEKYRTLVENVPQKIFIKDRRSVYVSCNKTYASDLSITPEEIAGKTDYDFFPKELADKYRSDDMRIMEVEETEGFEEQYLQDGETVWVYTIKTPVRDKEGKTVGLLGVFTDITVRKQAEQALRESEERYRLLMETLPDGVIVHSQGRIVFANRASATIIGAASPADLIGKPVLEFVHPDHRELALKRNQQLLSEGVPVPLAEENFVRLNGTPIDLEVSSSPFSYAGKPAMLNVFNDITERMRVKETLRQRLTELEALYTVSAALRVAQTRGEALPIVLDETLAVFETDSGAIWLYHPEHDELRADIARGWFRQLNEAPMKPGEGVLGAVFASEQSHVSAEFRNDPMIARDALREQIPDGWGGAFVPIRTGVVTIGVLLVSMPIPCQITPEQVKLLESLAEMAGTALHRMSLHEETVRQLDRLQSLHNIDLAITASFDLRMTLNILLEHVVAQLQVDTASVLLLNPHLQTLEYATGHGFRTRAAQTIRIRLGESLAGRAALERRVVQADDLAQIQENPQFAALWAGEGFVAYYGVPLIAKGKVNGVLEVFHRAPLAAGPDWVSFFEMLAGQAAIAIDNTQLFENLEHSNIELILAYDATIEGWSHALDLRDKETEGHTQRVTEMTLRLAKAMGISEDEIIHLRRGVLLHDIGKMGVTDAILLKPGPLSDAEWVVMRQHPQFAFDMLAPISYLKPALDVPYCHHEKWDGTGYPRGLKGEQIPLTARLFAVVDVWDALRCDRPYREAWPEGKVLEHIKSGSGTHFDPKAVELFLRVVSAKTEEHQGAG